MIYDISVTYEDDDVRVVSLDAALTDFDEGSYRAELLLDKTQLGVGAKLCGAILYSNGEEGYEEIARNEVPSWFKNLVRYLEPRMHEVMETGIYLRSFVEDTGSFPL